MTDTNQARALAKRAGRAALGPVTNRLDLLRRDIDILFAQQAQLGAAVEQAVAATHRLEAYFDRFREELHAELGGTSGAAVAVGASSILTELAPTDGAEHAGAALRARLDHGLLHAEAVAAQTREAVDRQLGELRSTARLTQSLVERALANSVPLAPGAPPAGEPSSGDRDAAMPAPSATTPSTPAFTHPVPSFDLLYRAFEDRHRGDPEMITRRQGEDYLDLLRSLPHPELPVADLGCGRGELVRLLDADGMVAVGVDSNHGQVADGEERLFVEDDLFRWLDAQPDGSHRAVVSMHVVEHLPLDLQIRLVFEARRVLAEGGVLVLETPNALSLSTAATNFWVDPTHERPVHPLFLEFLADEAGFAHVELRPLHAIPASFQGAADAPELAADLASLILGDGDLAVIARR